jgi:MFS family permease
MEGWESTLVAVQVLSMAGRMVMMPFNQGRMDDLGCKELCYGAMASYRSALQLIGSPALGRLSDTRGRRLAYLVACAANAASLLVFLGTDSVAGLFLSATPAALLSDVLSVSKVDFRNPV